MKRFLINSVTFLRIILGLAFFWVVLFDFNVAFLVLIFILTAISDVSDGWLSRKYGLESDAGAKFDVICDFIFIMLSTLSLVLIDMIPSWFVLIIVLKMLEFFITSGQSLVYERFGHLVALMFYAFPIFAVLVNDRLIILILAIFITVCALISSAARFRQKFY
ncbi:MAG: CDP-alcohol phosphatidyltransferase family protein [Methanobrevibacter sp.]|uniref:CDP-alcohol phosphatidyltransferase family protein n=1 Tax=Methanobrevibacter sp. TaxID=66852 RepID=UPI001B237E19|nr:CDP-alcohol phosphatidyltransferase family protein [Methanobrevibacter sp.]MBO5152542.1 CDP-alcohol phosphatidyltransferase family protein [Methanobrevibacter sp.]